MRKYIFLFILLFSVLSSVSFSQNASTFFPASTGYKWFFKNTPLDSLNNPQSSLATYQIDSFTANVNYKGLPASMVLSKSGLTSINQNSPFSDTNYYNFQTTNAWYYLSILNLTGSIPLIDTVAFIAFLRSFEAWYSTYRFASTVNTNYTIFSRDTTLTIDTLTLPLRISATGRRLNDQNVSTINGTFLAKKFILTYAISYLLTIPPFPTIVIPVLTRPDTTYIASDIWIVKEVIPSVNVDLTSIGYAVSFSVPGSIKELTSPPTGIFSGQNNISEGYHLYQNFPNPFNPVTKIKFEVPQDLNGDNSEIKLNVFDILGKNVRELASKKLSAGIYEAEFDGSNLESGIYFYRLDVTSGNSAGENFTQVRKMILLK